MTEELGTVAQADKQRVYRVPESAITDDLRAKIASQIGHEAVAYPAKVGGSYKGPVIHADESFVVQAVGRERNSAVVHQRSDLEMQGAQLRQRDRNNDLNNRNIQVHYRGTTAKVFPLNEHPTQASERPAERGNGEPPKPDRIYREFVLATAADYARDAFKTEKQRETFVGHVTAMLDPNRNISAATPSPAVDQQVATRKGGLTLAAAPAQPAAPAEPTR